MPKRIKKTPVQRFTPLGLRQPTDANLVLDIRGKTPPNVKRLNVRVLTDKTSYFTQFVL